MRNLARHRIHSGPIRIHRNALRLRWTRCRALQRGAARHEPIENLVEVGNFIVRAAVTECAGHLEILEIVRLEAQPFRGHPILRLAYLAIAEESIATGARRGRRGRGAGDGSRAGQGFRRRQRAPHNPQIYRRAVRQLITVILRRSGRALQDTIVLFEVGEELIVGDRGSRKHAKVYPGVIRVRRIAVRFREIRHGAAVRGEKAWPFVAVMRKAQPKAHSGLRQERHIVILHPPHQIVRLRGSRLRHGGIRAVTRKPRMQGGRRADDATGRLRSQGARRRRIERVGPQIVVPEILVPPEHPVEVVPLVFVHVQPRNVVRIAAVTKVRKRQRVEQKPLMIQ